MAEPPKDAEALYHLTSFFSQRWSAMDNKTFTLGQLVTHVFSKECTSDDRMALLQTLDYFARPAFFLETLIKRFNSSDRDTQAIMCRFMFKWWELRRNDLRGDDEWSQLACTFVDMLMKDPIHQPWATRFQKLQTFRLTCVDYQGGSRSYKRELGTGTGKALKSKFTWNSLSAKQVAQYITLVDQELINEIRDRDLLCSRKKTGNVDQTKQERVQRTIDHSNKIANWVATECINKAKTSKRVQMLKKFIKVLQHLINFNNFNSAIVIWASLSRMHVQSLKRYCYKMMTT
mmetsp:Transcript_2703/g.3041  ORF Transcript_2703/g.3041 Transcript_2703/m.3041 type:complete len:289 (+) Transcript_2703:103-969(+)